MSNASYITAKSTTSARQYARHMADFLSAACVASPIGGVFLMFAISPLKPIRADDVIAAAFASCLFAGVAYIGSLLKPIK